MRETVGIEMIFDVLTDGLRIVPSIALHNEMGIHVMNALDVNPFSNG